MNETTSFPCAFLFLTEHNSFIHDSLIGLRKQGVFCNYCIKIVQSVAMMFLSNLQMVTFSKQSFDKKKYVIGCIYLKKSYIRYKNFEFGCFNSSNQF